MFRARLLRMNRQMKPPGAKALMRLAVICFGGVVFGNVLRSDFPLAMTAALFAMTIVFAAIGVYLEGD